MTQATDKQDRDGKFLGIALLGGLIIPQIYWLIVGYAEVDNWEKALWGFLAGAIFFSAYFFREQSFLFRGILWVFRKIHVPPGEWFAIVYGTLFFGIAAYCLLAS
jgi:hypothetical protein